MPLYPRSDDDYNPLTDGVSNLRDLEKKLNGLKQWAKAGSNIWKAVGMTYKHLDPGCYNITIDQRDDSMLFVESELKHDAILNFKKGMAVKLIAEINGFWEKEKEFKANGFLHRRGYLLYGSQGTGKSSMVQEVIKNVVAKGGVVFFCDNPKFFTKGLAAFREVEPNRPVVCVFEDIDAIIHKWGEAEILSLLDGDNQIDRVINIATTNYPEKLDKRIVSRPRRFDRVYKIEVPSDDVRIQFLKAKLPKGADAKAWISLTAGLSFAALTECLISVLCLGNTLEETVKVLRDLEENTPKISEFGRTVGFNADNQKDD